MVSFEGSSGPRSLVEPDKVSSRRRSGAAPVVFVLPLRKRVLFPGLRAQALVHESVYDAFVAHQKTLSPENALGHAKLVTVGVKPGDRDGSELETL
ncbi:hypothetical protein FOZ62_013047 [Perkinsus olseni]|uniref:Uncharacterized protein n=1 Tax=Perkinsus olseni TaxID=32597 RepID=A0A7J6Q586_PEROL|nr:hypothetical protein FOZ62_013047 [Perkinsus olseni]